MLIRPSQQKLQKYPCAVTTVRGRVPESKKFPGIQNSVGIERLFEPMMKITRYLTCRVRPPALLCQTDSMFACDHAAPRQHLLKKIVERAFDGSAHSGVTIIAVCHDVDVNITVPSVTKAGDRKSMLRLQLLGEFHQIDETTARHDHVLVQFR
jgi:hypothetical protein